MIAKQTVTAEGSKEMIETTIGDLICAIRDAASEANMTDRELQELTEIALHDLLLKYAA